MNKRAKTTPEPALTIEKVVPFRVLFTVDSLLFGYNPQRWAGRFTYSALKYLANLHVAGESPSYVIVFFSIA